MNNKNLTIGLIIVFVFGALSYIFFSEDNLDQDIVGGNRDEYGCLTAAGYGWNEEVGACVREFEARVVKLYYYNPEKDKDSSGNIMCSREGLVAIEREIKTAPTIEGVIESTINLLMEGNITSQEKTQGITTEYPLVEVTLINVSLDQNGELSLTFKDPQNKTGGGSCRVGILWFQIEETAKQFSEVKTVRFVPEELFQP